MADEQLTLDQYFDKFTPVKMGAPMKPMGKFPIAKASDILVEYDETKAEGERETRLPDALSNLGKMGIDKISEFDFTSGSNDTVSVDGRGISWSNNETQLHTEGGGLITTGASDHRVPLVAGDGIAFEVDQGDSVVRIKSTNTGGSTGGVGSGGIIDVFNELPTSNINEKAIYRLTSAKGDVYVLQNGKTTLYVDWFAAKSSTDVASVSAETYVVQSLPQSIEQSYVDINGNATLYLYIVYATGIAYLDFGDGITTVGEFAGLDNKGYLTAITGEGIYCGLNEHTFTYHVYKTDVYNGVGKWRKLLTDDTESKRTIQAVTTPGELDDILNDATDKDEGKTYMYVGTTGGGYKSGGVYRIERKELTNG